MDNIYIYYAKVMKYISKYLSEIKWKDSKLILE